MSTRDSLSISNYGLGNLYNDPAWQQYWMMSQQVDSLAKMQNANALGALTNSANTAAVTATSNPTFGQAGTNGAIPRAAEEKTSSNGALAATLAVGSTLALGTAFLVSRGKNAGANGFMNRLKAGWNSLGKKASAPEAKKLIAGFDDAGKMKYVELPGTKAQRFACSSASEVDDVVKTATTLGHDVPKGLKWTDEAAELNGAIIEIEHNGIKNTLKLNKKGYTIRNGENAKFKITDATDPEFKKLVDESIYAIRNKKSVLPAGATLKRVTYKNAEGNAYYRHFPGKPSDDGLKFVYSRRYTDLNDAAVMAQRNDTRISGALDELAAGNYTSFNVQSAEYVPAKTGWFKKSPVKGIHSKTPWPEKTSIVVENNKPVAIMQDGKLFKEGTTEYSALYNDFKSVFDDAMSHQAEFVNVKRFV